MDDTCEAAAATYDTLDLRGLRCPLPALRTRKALRRLAPGRLIEVFCTDPLAGLDIPNLVRETGDAVVHVAQVGDATRFLLRRGRWTARGDGGPDEDPLRVADVVQHNNNRKVDDR